MSAPSACTNSTGPKSSAVADWDRQTTTMVRKTARIALGAHIPHPSAFLIPTNYPFPPTLFPDPSMILIQGRDVKEKGPFNLDKEKPQGPHHRAPVRSKRVNDP